MANQNRFYVLTAPVGQLCGNGQLRETISERRNRKGLEEPFWYLSPALVNKFKISEADLTDVYNFRTFCLYEDIEMIKKNGLAKGGSLENAVVVKNTEILNPEGLRNNKEFVNHKILDCIGDLYTAGYRIVASINCSQGGHYLTNQLLRKVFLNKENFSIVEIKEKSLPHSLINKRFLRSIA